MYLVVNFALFLKKEKIDPGLYLKVLIFLKFKGFNFLKCLYFKFKVFVFFKCWFLSFSVFFYVLKKECPKNSNLLYYFKNLTI